MPAKPHYRERTKNCNWKLKITLCEERKQNVIPLPHKKTLADAMQAESSRGTGGGGDSRVLEGAIARKTAVASEPIWERFESLGKRRRYLGGSDPICYYCHQANPGSYVNARPQKNRWPQTRGTKEFSRRGLGLVQGRGRPRLALFSSGREMGTLIERRIGSASRNL